MVGRRGEGGTEGEPQSTHAMVAFLPSPPTCHPKLTPWCARKRYADEHRADEVAEGVGLDPPRAGQLTARHAALQQGELPRIVRSPARNSTPRPPHSSAWARPAQLRNNHRHLTHHCLQFTWAASSVTAKVLLRSVQAATFSLPKSMKKDAMVTTILSSIATCIAIRRSTD